MDVERFARELPERFDTFPEGTARDPRFADVLAAIPGLARANNLALLNAAVSLLPPDELYLEIGVLRATSLVASLLGNAARAVAVDSFRMEGGSRAQVGESLERFGMSERVVLVEADAFEVLRGPLAEAPVGVYYWDAAHGYDEQLAGLRLAERHLADEALVIVDDTDWERVRAATRDYLAAEPRARLLFDLRGEEHGLPDWWQGMQVLAWRA